MVNLVLCCGASGTTIEAAAANWQAHGLQQLVFGETSLVPTSERELVPEVPHTSGDEPCLGSVLAEAAHRTQAPWLLLVPPDAHLSPAALANLAQLARPDRPRQLVMGRAWRLPQPRLADPSLSLSQQQVDTAIAADGALDPPGCAGWLLLPRGAFAHAPTELSADPEQAVPWLVEQASRLGWPVLEASSAIPVLRPTAAHSPSSHRARPGCTGVVLPFDPGAPRLSLLVAGIPSELESLAERLRPVDSLPWEVITRPDLGVPGSTAAAWNSALADARGDVVWPLMAHIPALPLLPLAMRAFDAPWVDFAQFAWRLGSHHHPSRDPHRVEPGCLLGQRSWFQRVGGFDESLDAAKALQQVSRRALERGASIHALPLEVFSR